MAINHELNLTGTPKRRILTGRLDEDELRNTLVQRIKNIITKEADKAFTLQQKIEIVIKSVINNYDNYIGEELLNFCIKTVIEINENEVRKKQNEFDIERQQLLNNAKNNEKYYYVYNDEYYYLPTNYLPTNYLPTAAYSPSTEYDL